MSKVVIARKIPIRTVSKANNNPQPSSAETTTTSITNEQPTNPPPLNNNNTKSTTTNSTTTTNNNSQITTPHSSTPQPPSNNSSNSNTKQQQQPIDNNNIIEEDVCDPIITYEDIEKQSIKFRKFSKAFVLAKKKEQVRFYLPKVEQVMPQRDSKCSIVPLSMCILYHRQNGGEYALCIFQDKKMIDLCPLIMEKTEISIVLNPNQINSKQRSALQILSENLQGMNVDYYLQFESEMQLLSVYSALDKSLMYNGLDIKESIPTFNSLLITYSSRQSKELTSPRSPEKFKWCEKYVEQYSSASAIPEPLRTTKKKQHVKSSRKTEDNTDLSDSSSTSHSIKERPSQSENNSYSPVEETRGRYLEDNDDSLGSRHYIPSGDENTDSDGGRTRHKEVAISKSSPIQSSILLERKIEEDKYRPTANNDNRDGDSSSIPKISQKESTTTTPQENPTNPTSTKKVIKRVVKRVPAKSTTE